MPCTFTIWPFVAVFIGGLWIGAALGMFVVSLCMASRSQAPCEDCWLLECYRKQGQELQRAWGVANAAIADAEKETRQ